MGTLLVVRELTSKDETIGVITTSTSTDLPDYVNYLDGMLIDSTTPRTIYFSKKKLGNQGCSAAYYFANPQVLPAASTSPAFPQVALLLNLNPNVFPLPDPALLASAVAFANAALPDVAYPYRIFDVFKWTHDSYAMPDSPALVAKLNAANAGKGGCPLPQ